MRNKFQFIRTLLETNKFSTAQKERFLNLAIRELAQYEGRENQIWHEIEQIKKELAQKTGSTASDGKAKITYRDPKYLSDFLKEYNQDPVLKYTCHTIDSKESLDNILLACGTEEYDFKKHVELIHKHYDNLYKKYQGKALKNTLGLVSGYLGSPYGAGHWTTKKIRITWNSNEIHNWCLNNPGKVPNPLEAFQRERFNFPTITMSNGESINNFSDLILYFKNLFHVKSSNSLKPILESAIFQKFFDNKQCEFVFGDNFSNTIDLFTYTETLVQVFNDVITMSKRHYGAEKLKVKLYFDYDENFRKEFKIVITNSKVFGKDFKDFRSGDYFDNLIGKNINGLCDFYIKAYFNDQRRNGIINIWDGKPMDFQPVDEDIEGVEFILKMY